MLYLAPGSVDIHPTLADDGKRFQSDGRCILILSEAKGGGLEEGGLEVGRGRRLADDGKRFSSDGRFVISSAQLFFRNWEGVWGRGGARLLGGEG